jgi:uncharacterized membrane protein
MKILTANFTLDYVHAGGFIVNQTKNPQITSRLRKLSFILPSLMLASEASVIYQKFYSLNYTSDGFHYYSFLRNISNFASFYEGPAMEYLLGVHSYFSLVLLTPIVKFFNSPITLALLNPTIYLVSSIFLYKICFFFNFSAFKSLLMTLIFLTTPLLNEARLGIPPYMFQPDILAIPLILALYLAIIKQKTTLLVPMLFFLVFTKEEWIVFSVFLIVLFALFDETHRSYLRKNYRIMLLIWMVCSVISIISKIYFSSLNEFSHAPFGKITLSSDLLLHALTSAFDYSSTRWWPYFILGLFLALIATEKARAIAILFVASLMVLFRYSINVVIYGDARPLSGAELWSTHAFVTPLAVLIILQLVTMVKRNFVYPVVSMLMFVFLLFVYPYKASASDIQAGFSGVSSESHHSSFTNFKCIQSIVDRRFSANQGSYFISSEYLMAPAMERSHVSLGWAQAQKNSKALINESSGVLVYTQDLTEELKSNLQLSNFIEDQHSCGQEFRIFYR